MNPILSAIAAPLLASLGDVKTSLQAVVASPTLETVTAQEEKLALDALNPTSLEGLTLAGAAQEALNIISALESHLTTASAAPSVAVPPAA